MSALRRSVRVRALACVVALVLIGVATAAPSGYLSPSTLVADRQGRALYVGCATSPRVVIVDPVQRSVKRMIEVPGPVSGLTLTPDERTLIVTCGAAESTVCLIDATSGSLRATFASGHTTTAPVVSPDGKTLFLCNRFTDDVSIVDLVSHRELRRILVRREPVAAALTHDGRHILVANLIHNGRADVAGIHAVISVIAVDEARVVKELPLPDGGGVVNDLRISPDGRYAAVTHLIGRYYQPTSQVERGWINTNALTLLDVPTMSVVETVLLDAVDRGAANPWGLAWTGDGRSLVVAHSGLHEVSVIDFPGVVEKIKRPRGVAAAKAATPAKSAPAYADEIPAEVSRDLTFLATLRRRVALADGDLGPRAVAMVNGQAWIANYFSDTLSVVAPDTLGRAAESLRLAPQREMTPARFGEFQFHNARLCFQGWQSCASCHPGDARVDGLNWDQLNDGLGNPKNNRSLLLTFKMSPVMSLGVRADSRTAVRAGVRHAMFTEQPEDVAEALDAYLESLRPVPSPRLVRGELSPTARRGERLYFDSKVGCAECHPRGQTTDMKRYDVGTRGPLDRPNDTFYTPTLIETWRTAPYLHDGSAATMREVLTTRNSGDLHGRTSHLKKEQIDDLLEYVLSL
jgi:DNA-binding beta-propeller fold protein YncE